MKKNFTRVWLLLFVLALMPAQDAFAAWQIHYSGKAAKMFGYGGRGNFATKSQCESYRTSRPGFESMNSYCSGFDPPKPTVAPAPTYRPPSGQSTAGQAQQPDPAVLAAQRLQEEVAAKQREQVAAMERAAAAQQQQQFDQGKGVLAGDLRSRLNASGAMSQLELSACWSKLAARTANQATAKKYADYAIAAREGKTVPACDAGPAPAVPMPQGVTIVDDDKVRRMEEQLRADPRIATLYGKREEAKATAEKKKAEVESLEKISRGTTDPKAKEGTDALLTEAKKALAEAQEEDRRATEEINRAEKEWKALNDAKARAEQARPGASGGGNAAR
jgi:hypothetical protein